MATAVLVTCVDAYCNCCPVMRCMRQKFLPVLQPANAASVDWLLETRTDVWPLDLWNSMRARRGRPLKPPQPTRYSGPGYGCTLDGNKCCYTGTSSCPQCPSSAINPSALWGCGVRTNAALLASLTRMYTLDCQDSRETAVSFHTCSSAAAPVYSS